MVRRRFGIFFLVLMAGAFPACLLHAPDAGSQNEGRTMTIEEIAREAESVYEQALKEGVPKPEALERVTGFVKRQEIVASVSVAGPNALKVIFKDGNDLLMLLGRER